MREERTSKGRGEGRERVVCVCVCVCVCGGRERGKEGVVRG